MAVLCCNGFWSTCSSALRWTVQQQQQQHSSAELNAGGVDTKRARKQKWTRGGKKKNLIPTDADKDEPLCASVTGRDNIPKLEKTLGDRRTETHVFQRQALEGLGRTCLTGTTGLQTLGVLWLEERPCWCRGGRTEGIPQTEMPGEV